MDIKTIIDSQIADLLTVAGHDPERIGAGFSKLKERFPEHTQYLNIQEMFAYDKLHQFGRVVRKAGEILAVDPLQYSANLRKARALGMLGRYDEAVACFERMLTCPYSRDELLMIYAHYIKMLMSAKRWQEATAVIHKALELDPRNIVFRTKLAMSLKSAGQYGKALDVLRPLPDNDPYVRLERAHVFLNMRNAERGRQELEAAKKLFQQWRLKDKRLRNYRERTSLMQRIESLEVALRAVEGDVAYAQQWFTENYARIPSAKLVGVILSILGVSTRPATARA